MKTYIKTLRTFLIVAMLLLVGISQNKLQAQASTSEALTGSWLFDDVTSFSKIALATKKHLDSLPTLKAQFESAYRGRKVYFGSDRSYKVVLADGRSVTGSWMMTSNDVIQITDPTGTLSYQKLIALNQTQLVIVPMIEGDLKSMITQWHFIKL